MAPGAARRGNPALFLGYHTERKAREMIVKAGAAMVFTRGVMIPAA